MRNIGKYIIVFSLLLAGLPWHSASAAEMMTEWESFPSMEWRHNSTTVKATQICPTERYVYALVQGHYFNKTAKSDYDYMKNAYLNLLVYDTQNPELGFRNVQYFFPDVAGVNLSVISYNAKKHYLLAAYQDGQIDMIYDDGRVVRMTDFKDSKVPGSKIVNSISFDHPRNEAYLSTRNGYIVVDEESATVKEWVKLWGEVYYINRVGDQLLAIAPRTTKVTVNGAEQEVKETTLVAYDLANGTPDDIELFEPIVISEKGNLPAAMINGTTGNLKLSDSILQLTENTFATVGNYGDSSSSAFSVLSFTKQSDGSWRPLTLIDDEGSSIPANYKYFSSVIGGINNIPDGYSMKFISYYTVADGSDPDFTITDPKSDYIERIVTRHSDQDLGTNTKFSLGGTYNKTDFWTFGHCWSGQVNGGFVHYVKDSETSKLKIVTQSMRPDAPDGMFGRRMEYIPGYGMYVGGLEYSRLFEQANGYFDFSSIYKNGTWRSVGIPMTNPTLHSMVLGLYGLAVDPDDPKYVYVGSYGSAILRKNVKEDETTDLLHIAYGSKYDKTRACDVEFEPNFKTKYNLGGDRNVATPSFDGDGRLWASVFDYNAAYKTKINKATFVYWEKEDRLASKDKESFRPWKTLIVNGPKITEDKQFMKALKHPSNKNILLLFDGTYNGSIWVINHRGTPEDPSDDITYELKGCVDPDGRSLSWDYIYDFVEDPEDGRVWILNGSGLYVMDLSKIEDNSRVLYRAVVDKVEGVSTQYIVSETSTPLSMTFDLQNRKWIGTNGGGIICLSADSKELLGTFTSKSSGLQNDVIFGLGWNPENNSLMISHERGIQEMRLIEGESETSRDARIYPASVIPGYKGHITASGLVDSKRYMLTDEDGRRIKELGHPQSGRLQWDLYDESTLRVSPGKYWLVNSATKEKKGSITVVE